MAKAQNIQVVPRGMSRSENAIAETDGKRVISVAEASAILGMSDAAVRKAVRSGQIAGVANGSEIYIYRPALLAAINGAAAVSAEDVRGIVREVVSEIMVEMLRAQPRGIFAQIEALESLGEQEPESSRAEELRRERQ